jgi:hypothetical protein
MNLKKSLHLFRTLFAICKTCTLGRGLQSEAWTIWGGRFDTINQNDFSIWGLVASLFLMCRNAVDSHLHGATPQ